MTIFYLENCPYCKNAKRAIAELTQEHPELSKVSIHWIEESREPETAGKYDYYYVPTVFLKDRKLYEASPAHGYQEIKKHMENALREALKAE